MDRLRTRSVTVGVGLALVCGLAMLWASCARKVPEAKPTPALHTAGIRSDTKGLRLQLAHLEWQGDGLDMLGQGDQVERLPWHGPGADGFRGLAALAPKARFRVVELKSFPVGPGATVHFPIRPDHKEIDRTMEGFDVTLRLQNDGGRLRYHIGGMVSARFPNGKATSYPAVEDTDAVHLDGYQSKYLTHSGPDGKMFVIAVSFYTASDA